MRHLMGINGETFLFLEHKTRECSEFNETINEIINEH